MCSSTRRCSALPYGKRTFPLFCGFAGDNGIDPVTEPIPVTPAAHYHCGGVAADLTGRTSVPGLYAIGEVACTGVHGANRLASNSLTEALVAGVRCAQAVAGARPVIGRFDDLPDRRWVAAGQRSSITGAAGRYAGVQRDHDGLEQFAATLDDIPSGPHLDSVAGLEASNLHLVAGLLAAAAGERRESRGCHRRSDHPAADPAWQRHISLLWSASRPAVAA